jgi:hypothetical protein
VGSKSHRHIWYRSSLSAPSESDGGWLFLDAIGEVKAQKQKKTPETAEKDARLLELPEQEVGQTSSRCVSADLAECPLRLVSRMRSVAEATASAIG